MAAKKTKKPDDLRDILKFTNDNFTLKDALAGTHIFGEVGAGKTSPEKPAKKKRPKSGNEIKK